jgi:RHS repeat-associated protein
VASRRSGGLIKVTNGATVVQSRYNALGQRVEKSNGDVFMYNEDGHLIGEYSKSTDRMQREIVYLGDEPVALLTQTVTGTAPSQVVTPNVFYIFSDHLGTPRMITQATDNAIRWRWDEGDPFGLQPPNENPSGLGALTFNLRMPGQYYDRESNLFYNYFRDYDPQTGRYVQSDPIGLRGGFNTYSYIGGNPLSYSDPMGLAPKRFGKNHPHCKGIRGKMTGLQNELDTRWGELVGGLPERIGPGERLAETMRGHRKLINKADSNLRYWEKNYAEDCDDDDDSEDEKGNPCEVYPSGSTVAKTAAGVGAAYVAYRCIRMLPSLAPPLWWTIPANAAIP